MPRQSRMPAIYSRGCQADHMCVTFVLVVDEFERPGPVQRVEMNRIFPSHTGSAALQTSDATDLPSAFDPASENMRLRSVHRAIAELRRGTPVLLTGDAPLLLLAAETASAATLNELASLATGRPVLLLAPMRAAAVLQRPIPQNAPAVALSLSECLLAPEALLSLADPTVEQLLPDQTVTTSLPAQD